MFKMVYPFSPALIQALVAVSSALQRERTALKLMLQMLVNRRDTLRLGDVIPLGDLWDVVAHGDEAFTDVMRVNFTNAKNLYQNKLVPMLEQQHGIDLEVDREKAKTNPDIAERLQRFDNDDRLLKSLLLSALVHGVESLYTIMGPGCKSVARTHTKDTDIASGVWADGRIGTYRGLRAGSKGYGNVIFGAKADVSTTGAVGGYIASHLTAASHDVIAIDGWPEHVEVMRSDGLRIVGMVASESFQARIRAMHLTEVQSLAKGPPIDIAIVSVNDAFVMNAWKRDTDQRDEAVFLADGNADFAKAIGMELDASGNGLGIRSKRYSMLVENGTVKKLNLEPAPGKVEVSGGDTLLGQL